MSGPMEWAVEQAAGRGLAALAGFVEDAALKGVEDKSEDPDGKAPEHCAAVDTSWQHFFETRS